MLNFRKIFLFTFITFSITLFANNPFHTNVEKKVPTVRNAGSATPIYLVELQMRFRDKMSQTLEKIKNGEGHNTLAILLYMGFLYGIVHAAGPGHRKTILFSIFLSNKSKWWEPGVAGLVSAFLHGLSGVALILIFKFFSTRMLTTRVDLATKYLETSSFLLLLIVALVLFILKLKSIIKKDIPNSESKKSTRNFYYTVFITSIFPCPGAILVLILALSLGILNIGILTVVVMSVGMGITISATAYLGRGGREGIFKSLKAKSSTIETISSYIELLGYLFLLLLSTWMILPIFY